MVEVEVENLVVMVHQVPLELAERKLQLQPVVVLLLVQLDLLK